MDDFKKQKISVKDYNDRMSQIIEQCINPADALIEMLSFASQVDIVQAKSKKIIKKKVKKTKK